ncbi:hypothetical protein G9A89_015073 [Geosiphon pyriformis]|nr:hypothetical protein G9A89_015073 [Geosiphon pyriformis]
MGYETYDQSHKTLVTYPHLLMPFEKYARFAEKAYCLGESRGKVAEGIYFETFVDRSETSTEVIVYIKGNPFDEHKWYLSKFDMVQYEEVKNAKVIGIFFSNIQKTRWHIIRQLSILAHTHKIHEFRITGHDIGGVYAVLLGLFIQEQRGIGIDNWNVKVYTYGMPRIGNKFFAEHVDLFLNVFRITYANDYVVQMPPNHQRLFKHVGTEFWIMPYCECEAPLVFECIGEYHEESIQGETHYIIDENPNCNNQYSSTGSSQDNDTPKLSVSAAPHNGPYFQHMMGICAE